MEHSITPPHELVKQWLTDWDINSLPDLHFHQWLAVQAARWGADAELDACCEWIADNSLHHADSDLLTDLRASRRPKIQSEKERALEILERLSKDQYPCNYQDDEDWDTIRRALESIPDSV